MKNLIQISITLLLLSISTSSLAQNFIVTVESTYQHGDYIVPLKPGATKTFEVKVKNNRQETYTVSIRKNDMGNVKEWMSFSTESISIQYAATATFHLTITVPSGATEGHYALPLEFDARDENNNVISFYGNTQNIIIDSSTPDTPTYSHYSTSSSIYVYDWSSRDYMSNTYTTNNNTAGIGGIKSYILNLSKSGYSKSKTFPATGDKNYSFSTTPNTTYTLSVTAVDMAGNTKTSTENVSTVPAKVTGLSFSNIKYTNATLSWNASGGATSYTVNKHYNGETTTVASNITSTSYTIPGLRPDETYDFYVFAKNSSGSSDSSDKATVTTASLPSITGNSIICSGNYSYSIDNLLPGYTISWNSELTRVSEQGSNPCTFQGGQATGYININATITDSYSTSAGFEPKVVWVGKPEKPVTEPAQSSLINASVGSIIVVNVISVNGGDINDGHWSDNGTISIKHPLWNPGSSMAFDANASGYGTWYVNITNECGTSYNTSGSVDVSGGGGGPGGLPGGFSLNVSPNPASETLNIELIEPSTESTAITMTSYSEASTQPDYYEIQIWSERKGMVKKQKLKGKKNQMDISSLQPGLYYVHLIYDNKVDKKQLIVE